MFKNNPAVYFLLYRLGLQPALTQTTRAEQECLAKWAQGKRILVEIGVWHGVNTRRLRELMDPQGQLWAIDPFPRGRLGIKWQKWIAHREAAQVRSGTVKWLEEYSDNAVVEYKKAESRPIDFLFVDGDHSYEGVRSDWNLWSPLVRSGGAVALHDSRSYPGRQIDHVGAARFTEEVILSDPEFRVVDTCDSITVLQKL